MVCSLVQQRLSSGKVRYYVNHSRSRNVVMLTLNTGSRYTTKMITIGQYMNDNYVKAILIPQMTADLQADAATK
jgi:hypothetical protein